MTRPCALPAMLSARHAGAALEQQLVGGGVGDQAPAGGDDRLPGLLPARARARGARSGGSRPGRTWRTLRPARRRLPSPLRGRARRTARQAPAPAAPERRFAGAAQAEEGDGLVVAASASRTRLRPARPSRAPPCAAAAPRCCPRRPRAGRGSARRRRSPDSALRVTPCSVRQARTRSPRSER